jgi:hypothetical protein
MTPTLRSTAKTAAATAILSLLLLLFSGAHAPAARSGRAAAAAPARLAYGTGTATSAQAVWVAAVNGTARVRLGLGNDPLLAPNGQFVAASLFGSTANSEQGPALALYSATGAPARTYLSLATATAAPLAWSPDSRYLAVSFQSTSTNEAETARLSGLAVIDTSTAAVATIASGLIFGASFAADGSDRIAYGRASSMSLSAPTNVFVSAADGSGARALTSDGRSLNPVWGPRSIAYDRERRRPENAPVYQIWLGSPSGGAPHKITNLRVPSLVSGLVPIAFSGNGSRLLAEFEGQDTSEAWTVAVAARRTRRVRVRGRPVVGSGISRDGRTLLIDENALEEPPSNGRVASIPFAGGHSRVLIAHGSQSSWNR